MKAIRYSVEVYEGVLDFAHGHSFTIAEVFIPELEMGINFHNNVLKMFKSGESRYEKAKKIEELELDENAIKLLINCSTLNKECEEHFKKFF